jgi:hypothetical protein
MTHLIYSDPAHTGFAYGMLRDLEQAIASATGGKLRPPESIRFPAWLRRFTNPSTRYAAFGQLIPPRRIAAVEEEVVWFPLMGPEDYPYWFGRGWNQSRPKSLLYLFDTFRSQWGLIEKLCRLVPWDLTITSFSEAVPDLQQLTRRTWHCIAQGITPTRFYPLDVSETPAIAFSSYGRRVPKIHAAIQAFCKNRKLHYDFTVASGLIPNTDPCDNYELLGWHLRQSWFSVCWPVEVTHPARADRYSPMTCRWFESAASGSIMIGQAPRDPNFARYFGSDLVEPLDPEGTVEQITRRLVELWDRRSELRAHRLQQYRERAETWTWSARVAEMTALLE